MARAKDKERVVKDLGAKAVRFAKKEGDVLAVGEALRRVFRRRIFAKATDWVTILCPGVQF
eukprot:9529763-Lingulodinium_polyedra.AAC.1